MAGLQPTQPLEGRQKQQSLCSLKGLWLVQLVILAQKMQLKQNGEFCVPYFFSQGWSGGCMTLSQRNSETSHSPDFSHQGQSVCTVSLLILASELKSVSRCSPGAITRDSVLRPSRKHGREFLFLLAPGNSYQDSLIFRRQQDVCKQDCRCPSVRHMLASPAPPTCQKMSP